MWDTRRKRFKKLSKYFFPLFRIRIRGSVPLTNRSCSVRQWPSRGQPTKIFFIAYYFLKVHLHHSSKVKKLQRSHKRVKIKVFLTSFAWWCKDPGAGSVPLTNGFGSGRPNNLQIRIRNTGWQTDALSTRLDLIYYMYIVCVILSLE